MEFVGTFLVTIIVAAIIKWIWDRYNIHQTWQKLNIPGPKSSSLLFGNIQEVVAKGTFPIFEEWRKKYGKVFGYYQSCTPILVVSDADMMREILIKQFDNFEERVMFTDDKNLPLNHLVSQGGEQWKKVRGLSSPTFSAKRIKEMSPLVHKSVDKLMARFNKRAEEGKAFDISNDVKRLTLDVIASTAFSQDTDVFNEEDNIFLRKLIEGFKEIDFKQAPLLSKLKLVMALLFPGFVEFSRMLYPMAFAPIKTEWFTDLAKRMIQDRINTGEYRSDYIQLMLIHGRKHVTSGSTSGTDTEDDVSDNEQRETARDLKLVSKKKELTMEEMQGQVYIFLAAGFETTATTLANFCYYMALYPEIQTKLQEEIDQHFPNLESKPVTYESVQNLPYLDMTFCETSRLASVGQIAVTRMCIRDTEVCGYRIPKGAKIAVNMVDIHQQPEHWGPEPVDQFVPERFTKERKGSRHPMAYIPFGGGPRNCIGMRFAIMEAKMEIINMLKRFTIVKCLETQVPLKMSASGARGPTDGVFVKLVKRNDITM